MHLRSFILLLCVWSMLSMNGSAQQTGIIDLRHADRLEGKVLNGEVVRELIGNVHFVQFPSNGGPVNVWCDRALRYMVQNKIELYGHVRVVREDVTLRSSEGVYYGDTRIMEGRSGVELERGRTTLTALSGRYFVEEKRSLFWDRVILIDTTSVITCNTLEYFETETRSVATGTVHVFEYANAINIYGDSLIHIEQDKFTQVMKRPRLVKIDTSAGGTIDTLVVVSTIMQSYQDSTERFVAIDHVQMVKSDIASRCGTATFYLQQDFITLETNPIIWSGVNQITGDSIRVFLEDNKLRRLWVKNRAMAVSHIDSLLPNRFNQLTGRELTMYFRAHTLEQVDVKRTASSLYYLFDSHEPNGANKSSGDRIIIDFLNGDADRIKVIGGVQGQYFPETMIFNNELNFNLDGFHIYSNRPIRQGIFIITK